MSCILSFFAEPIVAISKIYNGKQMATQAPLQGKAETEQILLQTYDLPKGLEAYLRDIIKKSGLNEQQIVIRQSPYTQKIVSSHGSLRNWKFAVIIFKEQMINEMNECLVKYKCLSDEAKFIFSRELGYLENDRYYESRTSLEKKQGYISLGSYLSSAVTLAGAALHFFSPYIAYPLCIGAHLTSCAVARYTREYFRNKWDCQIETFVDSYPSFLGKEVIRGGFRVLERERQRNLKFREQYLKQCQEIIRKFPESDFYSKAVATISTLIDTEGNDVENNKSPPLSMRISFLKYFFADLKKEDAKEYPYSVINK